MKTLIILMIDLAQQRQSHAQYIVLNKQENEQKQTIPNSKTGKVELGMAADADDRLEDCSKIVFAEHNAILCMLTFIYLMPEIDLVTIFGSSAFDEGSPFFGLKNWFNISTSSSRQIEIINLTPVV